MAILTYSLTATPQLVFNASGRANRKGATAVLAYVPAAASYDALIHIEGHHARTSTEGTAPTTDDEWSRVRVGEGQKPFRAGYLGITRVWAKADGASSTLDLDPMSATDDNAQ